MTSDELAGLLKAHGITQTSIAEELDPPVRISQVNNVVRGRSKSKRVRDKIAEKLGKHPENIEWPPYKRCINTIIKNN